MSRHLVSDRPIHDAPEAGVSSGATVVRWAAVFVLAASLVSGAPVHADDAAILRAHRLRDLEGTETTLSSWSGEVLVVNFWATWCAPCQKELPLLDSWHARWVKRGGRVLAISVDHDVRNARRFVESTGLALPVFHDGPDNLARDLKLPSLPCTYVLDGSGQIVATVRGSSPAELVALERTVEGLLSQRTQRATQASAIGSGVAR